MPDPISQLIPSHLGDIGDVIDALDAVVAHSVEVGDRLGYFAALYRAVTEKVRDGITAGVFDDPQRLERLDVVFAGRYLEALRRFDAGQPSTASWAVAFRAAGEARPIILQHLLVGINAHINLDLGIAAATVAPGGALPGLRRDFDRINDILAAMLDDVRAELAVVSPWIGLAERFSGHGDEEIVRFSVEVARAQAWRFAVELAPLPTGSWTGPIRSRDAAVARLGRTVLHPGIWLSGVLAVVRARESNDVAHNVEVLSGLEPAELEQGDRHLEPGQAAPWAAQPGGR